MTLPHHLGELETAGLIRLVGLEPELEYLFKHALVQDTTYAIYQSQSRRADAAHEWDEVRTIVQAVAATVPDEALRDNFVRLAIDEGRPLA